MADWLTIGACAMLVITVAHHLGLIDKMYSVAGDIAQCPMCSAFWGCLIVLLIAGCYIGVAFALSLAFAYMSNWVALLLDALARLYKRLWKRRKK